MSTISIHKKNTRMNNSVVLLDYIDKFVEKLCRFDPSSGDFINLLEILSYDETRVKDTHQKKFSLTKAERQYLQGALPHCLSHAQEEYTIPEENDNNETELDVCDKSLKKETSPCFIPSSKYYTASQQVTNLTNPQCKIITRHGPIRVRYLDKKADIWCSPQLCIHRSTLRRLLQSLAPWYVTEDMLGPSCLSQCTISKCTNGKRNAIKNRKPIVGRPRNDPLALLRNYCKHFHKSNWMLEYEKLVDDIRECTFQPNMQKYCTRQPGNKDDDKEEVNDETDCFGALLGLVEKHKVNIKKSVTFSKEWCFDQIPYINNKVEDTTTFVPKYSAPGNHYHKHCVNSIRIQPKKKRWEETLREEGNVSLHLMPSDSKKCIAHSKEKRYYHYDWGKYIRLKERHLKPLCVENCSLLTNLESQVNLSQDVLNPKPTLVEWSGGGSSKGAIFTAKTPVKDYKVNEAQNLWSILRHGIEKKHIQGNMKVIGIPCDPISDFEQRLEEAKPNEEGYAFVV